MKKIVFTFGMMNPPTVGHQKLVDKVNAVAKSNGADARVYLSHTQNNKKDPLDYTAKYNLAKKAFGPTVFKSNSKTIIQILQELEKGGYTDIVMVAGSDRVPEFKALLTKYNGNAYNFDSIDVVSAGERDPDAEGVEGMSASKLRALAKQGDFETFKTGLPKRLGASDAKKIYDTIRSVIAEEVLEEDRKPLTIQQRFQRARLLKRLAPKLARMRKIKAKRVADAKTIQKRSLKVARNIIRKKVAGERGAQYKELSPSEKITIDKLVAKKSAMIQKMARRLLPKVRKAEIERAKQARAPKEESFDINALFEARVAQDPTIKDREGTQPKKYFSGLSPSTKEKRDAAFQKGKTASDDSPSSYKPAPGDAEAETKPSKYTKKYKQMFGEQDAVVRAKDQIKREKEADKEKHDRLLDRARVQDTQTKNRQTEEYELSEDATAALQKKADKSGVSLGILRQVYNRGMAAWKTGHRPGATQQQWAFARVNSFLTGGGARKADADLWSKAKGRKEEVELDEARAKQAVAGNKVQKLVTGFDMTYKGKKYDEIDMELVKIDNGSEIVTFKILHPREHIGDEVKIPFKTLRRGRFMATDTSKINEACWDGYKQVGMKTGKDGKPVPNCVRESKSLNIKNIDAFRDALEKAKIPHRVFQRGTGDRTQYQIYMDKEYHKQATKLFNKIDLPESNINELSPELKKRYTDKATTDVRLTKRSISIGKEVGAKDVVNKEKERLQKRRIGIARANEPKASKNVVEGKKTLKSMLAIPSAYAKDEIDEDWFSNAIGKVVHKKGYEKAKEILKMVVDRKKKEGKLKHDIPYYAQQIARQFDGVDARELTKMVTEQVKMDPPEIGTDKTTKRFKQMTPGQMDKPIDVTPSDLMPPPIDFKDLVGKNKVVNESFQVAEGAGTGHTMYATEFMKIQGAFAHHPDVEARLAEQEACCDDCEDYFDHIVEESEYQGKKVKLNDPFRTPQGPKKFSVYVKNEKGNVVKVNFGDPNMEIKRDDPERRASFRARHGCDNPGPKWKARYWSCYQWRSGSKVDS